MLPPVQHADLLAGTADDAVAWRLSDDRALVFSVDVMTPVVNDPYAFGQVAAANALSDLYAMGAEPFLALNVVGYPVNSLPLAHLQDILRGGADKAGEAGAIVAGGHSLDDTGPKYGLAVAGFAHPDRLATRAGARPGDALILTKPLGIGVVTTAIDMGLAGGEVEDRAVALMTALNAPAARAMVAHGVRACTDVTGFGLLGHLREMLLQSGVAARLEAGRVPVLEEAWDLLAAGAVSRGTRNNLRFLESRVDWDAGVGEAERLLLCDAQTSGGLLMAVPPGVGDALVADLLRAGVPVAAEVGRVMEGPPGRIEVA